MLKSELFFARTWFFFKIYILELNWKIVPCFFGGQVDASFFSLVFFIWYCFCLSCKGFCRFSTPESFDNECCFSSLACSIRAVGLEGLNFLGINYASEVRNLFSYNYTFTDIISTKGITLEISENIQSGIDTNSPDGKYFPLLTQYTVLSLI